MMFDYDVWYNGMIIGNVKAPNDKAALKIARSTYKGGKHGQVTVERS
jgi:hypothetical protein